MMKILLFFSLSFLAASCGQDILSSKTNAPKQEQQAQTQRERTCQCTLEYAPVCNREGVRFENSCIAACNGLTPNDMVTCSE